MKFDEGTFDSACKRLDFAYYYYCIDYIFLSPVAIDVLLQS